VTKLLLFGAGGHGRSVLAALRLQGIEVEVFVDSQGGSGELDGVPIVSEERLPELKGHEFIITVGSVRPGPLRRQLFDRVERLGLRPWQGHGNVVLQGAVVNAGTRLGTNIIVNTGAIVEHDCVIGDDVHIAPRAVIGGGTSVGPGAHVGIGSTVREGLRIGAQALVAAGAVVIDDVADGVTVMGVPARVAAAPAAGR
jgi:sugar O-acyltransferase (sialic acid O-acetyltransferase NeuD family)